MIVNNDHATIGSTSYENVKVAIVHAEWHASLVNELVGGCVDTVRKHCNGPTIDTYAVPGSFEIPFQCQRILKENPGKYDVVVAIGILVKGETMHFEYIADSVSKSLMRVSLKLNTPIIFGVLTCMTMEQVWARCGLGPNTKNHGNDWGFAALRMSGRNVKPDRVLAAADNSETTAGKKRKTK